MKRALAGLLLVVGCRSVPEAPPAPKATPGIDVSSLDRRVDPCVDFYQFACGGWLARAEIPPDRPTWSRSFAEIQERNQAALHAILEDYAAGRALDEVPEAKKLGDAYAACMDEPGIEAANLGALEAELARIRVTDAASLEQAVARLHRLGAKALFSIGAEQDAKDASQVIGYVSQGGLGLPDRDHYLRTDARSQALRDAYLAHARKMLELSGLAPAAADSAAATAFRLEHALAEAALSRVDRRDPLKTYHRIDLAGLQRTAPHFPWLAYLADLGHAELRDFDVQEPAFFERVDALVQRTPPADWNAYLRWRLVDAAASALPARFVDEDFQFGGATLTGLQQNLPRWKRCVASLDKGMGLALAHAFVKRTFSPASKAAATELVQEIEAAFGAEVGGLAWMDAPTQAKAREKLAAITNQIGYPESWRGYDALEVSRASHLGNVFAEHAFDLDHTLGKVGKPRDKNDWELTPPTVNAYFDDSTNEMVFLAGILQPPFFDPNAAPAVNHGGIGMVMGHELTHGFDDRGRQYDARGNLADWWTPAAAAEFTRRAECVQQQFDGYLAVDDVHVNGKLTLGEDLADLGGLALAYRAMLAHEAKAPSPPSEFTPPQAFFLAEAQVWCRKDREAYARLLATTDAHAPARWRVMGPMSNLRAFADAWRCPAGAPMVRANACEVW